MSEIGTLAAAALLGFGSAHEAKPRHFSFAKGDLGKVPAGWKATQTNQGKDSSIWKVVADDSAPSKTGLVLGQTAKSPAKVFNLCVADDGSYADAEISVRFKAISGEVDQGGGIVWRYQDTDNYYVARMNPLEKNYRLYKVVKGKRIQLQSTDDDLKVTLGEWHKLTVRHVGDRIECFLDDQKLLQGTDNDIAKAGNVGLWTKADARTHFDGLTVQTVTRNKD